MGLRVWNIEEKWIFLIFFDETHGSRPALVHQPLLPQLLVKHVLPLLRTKPKLHQKPQKLQPLKKQLQQPKRQPQQKHLQKKHLQQKLLPQTRRNVSQLLAVTTASGPTPV